MSSRLLSMTALCHCHVISQNSPLVRQSTVLSNRTQNSLLKMDTHYRAVLFQATLKALLEFQLLTLQKIDHSLPLLLFCSVMCLFLPFFEHGKGNSKGNTVDFALLCRHLEGFFAPRMCKKNYLAALALAAPLTSELLSRITLWRSVLECVWRDFSPFSSLSLNYRENQGAGCQNLEAETIYACAHHSLKLTGELWVPPRSKAKKRSVLSV